MTAASSIVGVDLFCGAGGLTWGLQQAGVRIAAGIDVDPACKHPFERNNDAAFLQLDIREVTVEHLTRLWPAGSLRLLAGCAPCQPFSPHRRGADTSSDERWSLLGQFGRLAVEARPDYVTMENVPRLGSIEIFAEFAAGLEDAGYDVRWRSCRATDFALPQARRRLVLIASLLGPVEIPSGDRTRPPVTVREAIGSLPALASGAADPQDRLHAARSLSELNLTRIRASRPGGTWKDWPEQLRAPCHRRSTGSTFRNPYGRMRWDQPAPTVTTLAHNYGTGRFGHPEQDRAISLREAAVLQGFPVAYEFVPEDEPVLFERLGRLIGNAVPPPLGRAVGHALVAHAAEYRSAAAASTMVT